MFRSVEATKRTADSCTGFSSQPGDIHKGQGGGGGSGVTASVGPLIPVHMAEPPHTNICSSRRAHACAAAASILTLIKAGRCGRLVEEGCFLTPVGGWANLVMVEKGNVFCGDLPFCPKNSWINRESITGTGCAPCASAERAAAKQPVWRHLPELNVRTGWWTLDVQTHDPFVCIFKLSRQFY